MSKPKNAGAMDEEIHLTADDMVALIQGDTVPVHTQSGMVVVIFPADFVMVD